MKSTTILSFVSLSKEYRNMWLTMKGVARTLASSSS